MGDTTRTFKPAIPKASAPSSGSGAPAAAAASKKGPSMSFMPTIPGVNAKPSSSAPTAAGGPKGPPRMQHRALGAPPGHSRPGGGPKKGGLRPGFVPRAPAWVPVGAVPTPAATPSAAMEGVEGETKAEPVRRPEKQFTQADIAPTAQSMAIDPLNLGHPMTLPFLDPLKANPNLKKNDFGPSATSAFDTPDLKASSAQLAATSVRSMGTEAERSNPANLMFRNEDGFYSGEDQLFFIQMPSALPFGDVPVRPASSVEQNQVLGFRGNMAALPSGNIGKLLIYKSGKVKLKVGDQLFDVSTGMPCNFLQEVVAINTDKKKYFQLGDISRRMVCYPDIDNLLEGDSKGTPAPPSSSMDLS